MTSPYASYAQRVTATPQSMPILGREHEMVQNNAGGFGFILDEWKRLNRFLIIGSEGGTYYVGQQKLTAENAACVIRCVQQDGLRVVQEALDINLHNRAPNTDQQLFALALALKYGDQLTKNAVRNAASSMLRTGTHLLHFVAMLDSLGGWNRSKRHIVKNWFESHDAEWLAFQVMKYKQRDKWSMRDALRVAHPDAPTAQHAAVYDWISGRANHAESWPELLTVHTQVQALPTDMQRALWGVRNGLPREALPTEALADKDVLRELTAKLPPHALIRNLGNLTASGVIADNELTNTLVQRLTSGDVLKRSRVHPFAILLASLVYSSGQGVRGSKTWTPVRTVVEALDDAYEAAFDWTDPVDQRLLIAIDVSGSMGMPAVGTPISCKDAALAMAVTLARNEPHAVVVEADTAVRHVVSITRRSSLSNTRLSGANGGTDLTACVDWALQSSQKFDAFILLTDNETWAGARHVTQGLDEYRRRINPRAKLVCCSMAANHANVVDPNDVLSFGCAGLDASLPSLISAFLQNGI